MHSQVAGRLLGPASSGWGCKAVGSPSHPPLSCPGSLPQLWSGFKSSVLGSVVRPKQHILQSMSCLYKYPSRPLGRPSRMVSSGQRLSVVKSSLLLTWLSQKPAWVEPPARRSREGCWHAPHLDEHMLVAPGCSGGTFERNWPIQLPVASHSHTTTGPPHRLPCASVLPMGQLPTAHPTLAVDLHTS